ncbi:MAG: hypothetical protein RIQ62_1369 [Bacteroidota bacterium]|jgi:2-C-methyl-D-erythritol 4-phosphate cytidylyltransferase
MDYALIVAGGRGSRMKIDTPKQFLDLNGKPILCYTIQKFLAFDASLQIILVLPESEIQSGVFVNTYFPNEYRISVAAGGETRFHSVQNGLLQIPEHEGIVYIHDGVRPFVANKVLLQCGELARKTGSAIPSLSLKDSLRRIDNEHNLSVNRDEYRIIQTPQTFRINEIKNAYTQSYQRHFTDEASVFEQIGNKITLTEGNEENIKITTPQDLQWARCYLSIENNLSEPLTTL